MLGTELVACEAAAEAGRGDEVLGDAGCSAAQGSSDKGGLDGIRDIWRWRSQLHGDGTMGSCRGRDGEVRQKKGRAREKKGDGEVQRGSGLSGGMLW